MTDMSGNRQPQIDHELGRQEVLIKGLVEASIALELRLSRLYMDSADKDCAEKKNPVNYCDLAMTLYTNNDKLQYVEEKLRKLQGGIEISAKRNSPCQPEPMKGLETNEFQK